MFGRKKKEQAVEDKDTVPKLNEQLYEGSVEKEFSQKRHERRMKTLSSSSQEIFNNYRRSLKSNIVSGYNRKLYGGFWMRLFAFAIDMILVMSLQALFTGVLNVVTNGDYSIMNQTIVYVINQFILVLYFTLTSFWTNGQTIGKSLFGLQVVANHQYKLSFTTCLVREGLGKLILNTVPILGILVVFSAKRQNFMDYFTDTNVLSLNQFAMLFEENAV